MKTERHCIESSYAELWTTGIRKHPPSHDKLATEFIGLLAPKSGDVVVEIGTGEGRFISLLSKRQICYVGVDVCRRMFKYAKDNVMRSNKDYVHFVVSEAKSLPFKSKSVDKCFSYATMFFIPNKKQVIYEMVRISKHKVLIELRNILCPRIFSNLVKRRI